MRVTTRLSRSASACRLRSSDLHQATPTGGQCWYHGAARFMDNLIDDGSLVFRARPAPVFVARKKPARISDIQHGIEHLCGQCAGPDRPERRNIRNSYHWTRPVPSKKHTQKHSNQHLMLDLGVP